MNQVNVDYLIAGEIHIFLDLDRFENVHTSSKLIFAKSVSSPDTTAY